MITNIIKTILVVVICAATVILGRVVINEGHKAAYIGARS